MDERKIKDAVNSIQMSKAMENRLKMKCHDSQREKSHQFNFKKWGSFASVFGILLILLIGFPLINKNGGSQMTNFTITAYADDSIGHELLKAKTTFHLSTVDRPDRINSISGGGKNLIFTDIMLNVSGENIDSILYEINTEKEIDELAFEEILYEINKGIFIEDVTITKDDLNNKDKLLLEKINHIYGPPNAEIFQGIKEIGNTFTVKYSEQEQYKYSLAIPHHDTIEDDILINVTVTYTDGTSEQQSIIINQESDSISLVLN